MGTAGKNSSFVFWPLGGSRDISPKVDGLKLDGISRITLNWGTFGKSVSESFPFEHDSGKEFTLLILARRMRLDRDRIDLATKPGNLFAAPKLLLRKSNHDFHYSYKHHELPFKKLQYT